MCTCSHRFIKKKKQKNTFKGCPSGYFGDFCQESWSFPKYGPGCQKVCLCSKQRCNVSSGYIKKEIKFLILIKGILAMFVSNCYYFFQHWLGEVPKLTMRIPSTKPLRTKLIVTKTNTLNVRSNMMASNETGNHLMWNKDIKAKMKKQSSPFVIILTVRQGFEWRTCSWALVGGTGFNFLKEIIRFKIFEGG